MTGSMILSPWLILVPALLMSVAWLMPDSGVLSTLGWAILVRMAIARTVRPAARLGLICGLIHLLFAFHWVPRTIYETTNLGIVGSFAGFLLFLVWESIPFAAFAGSASILWRIGRVWVFVVVPIWVAMETLWPRVFPWSIAHTYLDDPPVVQLAELGGTPLIAAWAMAGSVLLASWSTGMTAVRPASAIAPPGQLPLAIVGVILVGCFIWGERRADQVAQLQCGSSLFRVAIVQVDPTKVGAVERLRELSDSIRDPVDLYVWPESSLGIYHSALADFRDEQRTTELSEAPNPALVPYANNRAHLLAGAKTYDEGGRDRGPYRNCAFLIDADNRIVARTSKRTLMPIGEYVPMEPLLPWIREWLAVDMDLVRGNDFAPLILPGGINIGVTVCYEDTDPSIAAANFRCGANVLVGLINASAFSSEITLEQHLRLARLRAVENRTWFLRCSSTGITCIIDPAGRVVQRLPCGVEGVLVANIPCTTD
ncbi:Apolipoprotein N-acyltransferase [Stieleria maiorica]|uniref:Apolipoprotein N-acyltransferase n=1 Tax=Stieleria maiorica TaxID=2795974 RepID=A0A5B9MG65_9BACT|nr:apolipoprotein N-acyltransferase [Stieleria maiorica]QEF99096.1 Apolipoprotein N-acyltransferase [Stieleria maiorica]